jgi:AcrR family transcriptional regulator
MSKSGLFAHFGSKEELQLATIEAANSVFIHEALEPSWPLCSSPTPSTS